MNGILTVLALVALTDEQGTPRAPGDRFEMSEDRARRLAGKAIPAVRLVEPGRDRPEQPNADAAVLRAETERLRVEVADLRAASDRDGRTLESWMEATRRADDATKRAEAHAEELSEALGQADRACFAAAAIARAGFEPHARRVQLARVLGADGEPKAALLDALDKVASGRLIVTVDLAEAIAAVVDGWRPVENAPASPEAPA